MGHIAAVFNSRLEVDLFGDEGDRPPIKFGLERNSRPIGIWLPLIFGLLIILKGAIDLR